MLVDVCSGLSLLEWEVVSRFSPKRTPLSNTITYRSTLIPMFAFVNGIREPRVGPSLAVSTFGILQSFILSPNHRPFGLLQRLGIASVLVSVSRDSLTGPLTSVTLWNLATIYLARNPKEPFKSASSTAQTRIDRAVAGEDHMLNRKFDPDGVLATLMTSVSMWIGNSCYHNIKSKNESFVTGISLFSMGYLCSYAFPEQLPFSETFWTLSFTLGTSGLSLLRWTASDAICSIVSEYAFGQRLLSGLETLGAHAVELFILSSTVDMLGITEKVESLLDGWKGKVLSCAFKNSMMVLTCYLIQSLLE